MLIDSTTGKTGINHDKKTDIPDALKGKAGTETHGAASINSDSQEPPLRAQGNSPGAKEAAMGAVGRFYQESKDTERRAEKLVSELEEVIQLALNATKKACGIVEKEAVQDDSQTAALRQNLTDPYILKNSSLEVAADSEKSSSDNKKEADDEVKAAFYHLLMTESPRLRHFIDDLTEDKARIKIDKIMSEAKSEIIAARIVVNKAQEEINTSKEAEKKALFESEATQKAAELLVSQVKQDAVSQSASEIARAHADVKAIQEAANAAVRRAEEEVKKSRDEVVTLSDYVKETLALAQQKVKKSAEEVKACKFQAQSAIKQAQDEAKKAREAAETIRREAKVTIGKAALESQQAMADIELARRTIQEATVMAEKQAYDKFCEEMKQMREEVDATNKKAHEVISKAQGESRQAKQELDVVKKTTEKELNVARKETLEAKKEAERAKQVVNEAIGQAQQDSRKAREEAEKSILKANEAIMQAKKDVINMTRGEIVRARQELEAPGKVGESVGAAPAKPADQKLNSGYVANVLHEMRAPLHSISGFARLMLEENVTDDKTRNEFLTIMVQQSESLNKLIDDISHTLNDKGEAADIAQVTVSPGELISEAVDGVQGIAQQKKNLISYDLNPALPEIEADAFRIKQVIVNLLTNAVKFSPEGSSIDVKAEVHNQELLVQVIDHGIGIPQADIPAIFDRHYQAKNRGDAEGFGLGLFICRQIIEAHGGRIWVESVEGEGSTFSFSLPIATARQ
jgi:nitrogen-specific signal transduction histidine kinase